MLIDLAQLNANKEQVGQTAPSLTVLAFDIRSITVGLQRRNAS
jgi:hypothetical protein